MVNLSVWEFAWSVAGDRHGPDDSTATRGPIDTVRATPLGQLMVTLSDGLDTYGENGETAECNKGEA